MNLSLCLMHIDVFKSVPQYFISLLTPLTYCMFVCGFLFVCVTIC